MGCSQFALKPSLSLSPPTSQLCTLPALSSTLTERKRASFSSAAVVCRNIRIELLGSLRESTEIAGALTKFQFDKVISGKKRDMIRRRARVELDR